MGNKNSNPEHSNVESTGHGYNNIIIQEAEDIHDQLAVHRDLLSATYILIFFEMIKLIAFIYIGCVRKFKKYSKNGHGQV